MYYFLVHYISDFTNQTHHSLTLADATLLFHLSTCNFHPTFISSLHLNTHKWGRKTYKPDVHYAFKSTTSEDELTEVEKTRDESNKYQDEIKALTAQLKEYATAYTARWSEPNEVKHDKKRKCSFEKIG